MEKNAKILVLGANGLVGSAIVRELKKLGFLTILTPSRNELELINQKKVDDYFKRENPQYVFLAAAKVGGILANNTYRANFIYENLIVEANVIHAAHINKVNKLQFTGSSCIYPKNCPQPIKEEYLLTGPLEWTNEPYAIAKIAGLKLCENYRLQYGNDFFSVMPTNSYGPNDHYDEKNSHVIPGLIARMNRAKMEGRDKFEVWGTGKSRREFIYVEDLAEACVYLMMQNIEYPNLINIGTGIDCTIAEVATLIKEKLGFKGEIIFDLSKPDGTPRKVLDVSLINKLGWKAKIDLNTGLDRVIELYLKSVNK